MAKPEWLKIKAQSSPELARVEKLISELSLNTVCDEAACPNRMECYGRHTATFMILGKNCTRNCAFCNVEKVAPETVEPTETSQSSNTAKTDGQDQTRDFQSCARVGDDVDLSEPVKVAKAVQTLGLKHVVITSVTRDDLPDGGASHFANVITELKKTPDLVVEVLIPDFQGDINSLKLVVEAAPHIIGHNIETIKRLYPNARAMANYERSLKVLRQVKEMQEVQEVKKMQEADPGSSIYTKSSIMLGLGETRDEVLKAFEDLRQVDCDFLCVGQYLSPTKHHHPVMEYVHPDEFARYKQAALQMGFKFVASGPFVRSSYHADEAMKLSKHAKELSKETILRSQATRSKTLAKSLKIK